MLDILDTIERHHSHTVRAGSAVAYLETGQRGGGGKGEGGAEGGGQLPPGAAAEAAHNSLARNIL